MLAKGLGTGQTSNFSLDEVNSYLDQPKLIVDRLLVRTRQTNKLNRNQKAILTGQRVFSNKFSPQRG